MLLGVILLIVGFVLFTNGFSGLLAADRRAHAVVNVIGGVLLSVINFILILQGEYFGAGTGFLFSTTYLWIAANSLYELDKRPFGIFSLFVAITTIPTALIQDDYRMAVIWLAWGLLWFTGFVETVLNKSLGKFVPVLAVLCGVFTGWLPGFLMMLELW